MKHTSLSISDSTESFLHVVKEEQLVWLGNTFCHAASESHFLTLSQLKGIPGSDSFKKVAQTENYHKCPGNLSYTRKNIRSWSDVLAIILFE